MKLLEYEALPQSRSRSVYHPLSAQTALIIAQKRREQNRLSQRAYRDRKEKYQRELEDQIAEWKQKQEELVKSYASQTEEVLRLKAQIEVLRTEVVSLQSGLPAMWGQVDQFSQDFDLVPH